MELFKAKLLAVKVRPKFEEKNWMEKEPKKYLSQIDKCICPKLVNVFVSNWEMYLYQIGKCICIKMWKCFCLKLGNVFVSNWEMYLSQIDKFIYVFVQNGHMYLFQIAKNVLVSSFVIQFYIVYLVFSQIGK